MSRAVRKPSSIQRVKTRAAATGPKRPRARPPRASVSSVSDQDVEDVAQVESLRAEVERLARSAGPSRWNANPDDVQRSVVKLVLTIVEFLRQLLERQAIRRMEAGTISAEETEAIGVALMRLEETVRDLGAQFDLTAEDLKLDLGPVGKLI
jgi:hypothetical protein